MRVAVAWLRRRAENIAAGMLAVMFVAFILQIVFRYFLNFPIGWTSELTVVCWLWLVLWGSAFVLKEREEIRFDLLYGSAGRRTRIAMAIIFSAAIKIPIYKHSNCVVFTDKIVGTQFIRVHQVRRAGR